MLKFFLAILSNLYFLGYLLKNFIYQAEFVPPQKLAARVVSVGNLTSGGTGKTPCVIFLAKIFLQKNKKVAILSRGYRRKRHKIDIFSDVHQSQTNWEEVGDEPFLMSQKLPSTRFLLGANRIRSGKKAIRHLGAEILILDDGFSYWRLEKDLEVLLLDVNSMVTPGKLLPSGNLREPFSNHKKADLIIFTGDTFSSSYKEKYWFENKPLLWGEKKVTQIIEIPSEKKVEIKLLKNKKLVSFCGLAQPQSFHKTLEKLELNVIKHFDFTDHFYYTKKELENIIQQARGLEAEGLITTEKDRLKIERFLPLKLLVFVVQIEFRILKGQEKLTEIINNLWK